MFLKFGLEVAELVDFIGFCCATAFINDSYRHKMFVGVCLWVCALASLTLEDILILFLTIRREKTLFNY